MIINETEGYCYQCQSWHRAAVAEEDGEVFFYLYCPLLEYRTKISHDANLFKYLRDRSEVNWQKNTKQHYSWVNLLEITNQCNFKCNICYAQAGEEQNHFFLEKSRIFSIIKKIKINHKLKHCAFTGGEPTMHPAILEIVEFAKQSGFSVSMPSNGLLIGKDINFLKKLKQKGLDFVYLQLDTLDETRHFLIRNNNLLAEKISAMANLKKLNMRFGLIATMLKDNLVDVGSILNQAIKFFPNVNVIVFQAAAPAGRFLHAEENLVDREMIIKSIIDSKIIDNLSIENFWAIPKFEPLWLDIHPDCAAIALVHVSKNGLAVLDDLVSMKKLIKMLGRSRIKANYYFGHVLFFIYLLRATKLSKFLVVLQIIFGLITKKGNHSLLVISTEQFLNKFYIDKQRIDHCTTKMINHRGELIASCMFNHPDENKSIID